MDTNRGETTDAVEVEERRRPGCGCWIIGILVLVALLGAGATGGAMVLFRTEQPLPGEAFVADLAKRTIMVPGEFQDLRIPNRDTVTAENGRNLYTVECALCHGDTGKGDGPFGITQYPRASDLTSATVQSKSDGQLFWLIAHGINLTGMPAWHEDYGGPHNDDEIWSLVKFIREEFGAPQQ